MCLANGNFCLAKANIKGSLVGGRQKMKAIMHRAWQECQGQDGHPHPAYKTTSSLNARRSARFWGSTGLHPQILFIQLGTIISPFYRWSSGRLSSLLIATLLLCGSRRKMWPHDDASAASGLFLTPRYLVAAGGFWCRSGLSPPWFYHLASFCFSSDIIFLVL